MKNKAIIKLLKILLIVISSITLIVLIFTLIIVFKLKNNFKSLKRIDEDGGLYYLEYTADYYDDFYKLPCSLIKDFGCSCFMSHNEYGDVITGRNYDLAHTDTNNNPTGLNCVVRLNPKSKYKSINIADAYWINTIDSKIEKGSLDSKHNHSDLLTFIPYLCMDGMNEMGLTCSILALDLKSGETAVNQNDENKEDVIINELLRYIIDNCKNVEEAINLANSYNMVSLFNRDYHLFISDKGGVSCILEWRYNNLYVTYQNCVTNCYVSFDDAENCYYYGVLKEEYIKDESIKNYKFGYGHGYNRYKTLINSLDSCNSNNRAFELLSSVSQEYDYTELTSYTQYSALYNNSMLELSICLFGNFNKTYSFNFEGMIE